MFIGNHQVNNLSVSFVFAAKYHLILPLVKRKTKLTRTKAVSFDYQAEFTLNAIVQMHVLIQSKAH